MDTINASTLIPAGLVVSGIGVAVALGIAYGKLVARIEALEKADESLKASIDALTKAINEIKDSQPRTNERLISIEIEQKQQREILEDILAFLKEKAKL